METRFARPICRKRDFPKTSIFSARQALTQSVLETELRAVCEQTGVKFIDTMTIREKDFAIPEIEALKARLYFRSFYERRTLS